MNFVIQNNDVKVQTVQLCEKNEKFECKLENWKFRNMQEKLKENKICNKMIKINVCTLLYLSLFLLNPSQFSLNSQDRFVCWKKNATMNLCGPSSSF